MCWGSRLRLGPLGLAGAKPGGRAPTRWLAGARRSSQLVNWRCGRGAATAHSGGPDRGPAAARPRRRRAQVAEPRPVSAARRHVQAAHTARGGPHNASTRTRQAAEAARRSGWLTPGRAGAQGGPGAAARRGALGGPGGGGARAGRPARAADRAQLLPQCAAGAPPRAPPAPAPTVPGARAPSLPVRVWVRACLNIPYYASLSGPCDRAAQAPLVAAGLVGDGRQRLRILERTSGRLAPGRLTLLLGAPASGKSTLLHALAGALHGGALKARPSPGAGGVSCGAGVSCARLRGAGYSEPFAARRGRSACQPALAAPAFMRIGRMPPDAPGLAAGLPSWPSTPRGNTRGHTCGGRSAG